MRVFKTSKKDRTNYNYYTGRGKITITSDDVGSEWIALLHEEDDTAVDAERREQYRIAMHYDGLTNADGDADGLDEKLDFMVDPEAVKAVGKDPYSEPEVLGITAMTKLLGGKKKFDEVLGELTYKPQGKPVLVSESDKRKPMNTAAEDFK